MVQANEALLLFSNVRSPSPPCLFSRRKWQHLFCSRLSVLTNTGIDPPCCFYLHGACATPMRCLPPLHNVHRMFIVERGVSCLRLLSETKGRPFSAHAPFIYIYQKYTPRQDNRTSESNHTNAPRPKSVESAAVRLCSPKRVTLVPIMGTTYSSCVVRLLIVYYSCHGITRGVCFMPYSLKYRREAVLREGDQPHQQLLYN